MDAYAQYLAGKTSAPNYQTPTTTGIAPVSSKGSEEAGTPMSANVAAKAGMVSALMNQRLYNDTMSDITKQAAQRKSDLQSMYDTALKNINAEHQNSSNNINNTASKNLQQAYINNMLGQKNLAQKMASQGLTGGATESTLARLINAYGNNRNSINGQKATDLANLQTQMDARRNSALSDYTSALSQMYQDAFNQRVQARNQFNSGMLDALNQYAMSGAADDNWFEDTAARLSGVYGMGLTGNALANAYTGYLTR